MFWYHDNSFTSLLDTFLQQSNKMNFQWLLLPRSWAHLWPKCFWVKSVWKVCLQGAHTGCGVRKNFLGWEFKVRATNLANKRLHSPKTRKVTCFWSWLVKTPKFCQNRPSLLPVREFGKKKHFSEKKIFNPKVGSLRRFAKIFGCFCTKTILHFLIFGFVLTQKFQSTREWP